MKIQSIILLLFIIITPLTAQDFYWENPEILVGEKALFPQVVANDEMILAVWQEFIEDNQGYTLNYIFSSDGLSWSEPQIIGEPVPFVTEQEVALYSLLSKENGSFLIVTPSDENRLMFFSSENGRDWTLSDEIQSEEAMLTPRLFENSRGEPILFMTRNLDRVTSIGGISLYFSQFRENWSEPLPLVEEENLNVNLLPSYHSFGDREYVVFQSLLSGVRITWQLYIKSRLIGEEEWGPAELVTDFLNNGDSDRVPEFYSNQRPFLSDDSESLILTWERNYTLESPQIYWLKLQSDGSPLENSFQPITTGFRQNAYPRLFPYEGNLYALWFDNRRGFQIVLSDVNYTFREPTVLSNVDGDSSYGKSVIFQNKLYFFWENSYLERKRLVLLAPDRTVDPPVVTPVSFRLGQRRREQLATFSWTAPVDSSGIRGYRYSWSTRPDEDPTVQDQRLLLEPQPLSFQAIEDGFWYFHIAAQDFAGNWSTPVHTPYFRDRTPPEPVEFIPPETDEWAYLASNTMTLGWKPSVDPDVAGYNYTLSYIGTDFPDPVNFPIRYPAPEIRQNQRYISFQNIDDGFWVLSVVAIDASGNVSRPSTKMLQLNKYIPVTYISWVDSERTIEDRIQLTITGRGFAVGGIIRRIILDKDGLEPYDYVFENQLDYRVLSDRLISGPFIEIIDTGVYQIAVDHPGRGLAWGKNQLSLDSTGTVKYGDFTQKGPSLWSVLENRALRLMMNQWTLYLVLTLLALVAFFSGFMAVRLYREGVTIAVNSRALVKNSPAFSDILKEEALKMKKAGLKLRGKFVLAFLSLVISTVLMVSIFLGTFMISEQQISLGDELKKRGAMLLDTLVTASGNYLPNNQRIEMRLLPNQLNAMEESRWMTIVGYGYENPDEYDYIWTSSDDEIQLKQRLPQTLTENLKAEWMDVLLVEEAFFLPWYENDGNSLILRENPATPYIELVTLLYENGLLGDFVLGETPYRDEISNELKILENRINEQAREEIGDLKSQLAELSLQAGRLALRTDAQSIAELEEIQNTISKISEQINQTLLNISEQVGTGSFPEYNAENLTNLPEDQRLFVFYKPVLYSESDSDQYYKGAVRLAISVDPLLNQLQKTQLRIIQITIFIFAAAILLGLGGSLFLASTMRRPIVELGEHVKIIAETENKKKLEDHVYRVRSNDEIGELGNIINNMTHGLVEAAKANEDLMAGKEIQKAFIPLEMSRISQQKHTTGQFQDEDLNIFGYYEGAKTVSGDYFDFRQLDDEHFVMIKCDIAGKGVAASLIMVEVATIFVNYFRTHKPKESGVDLADLAWTINDLLNEVGFKGRFAAFNIVLLNKKTGKAWMCHAGDREVNIYDVKLQKMNLLMLNDVPTAGSIDSDLLKMQNLEYKQTPYQMKRGDIIYLYTDGIEEAQNLFRDSHFNKMVCDGSCGATETDPSNDENNTTNHIMGETFEEFTTSRVYDIIQTVKDKGIYTLRKYHDPLGKDHVLTLDFSSAEGSTEETVLALIAAQFLFQLVPDPNASELDRVMMDRKVDVFMKKHFNEYREYFKYPVDNKENMEYIYYTHLKKDDQTDDLTILAVEKK